MDYKVKFKVKGYSYIDLAFRFDDRSEALDFAEIALSKTEQLGGVSIELIREEDAE